MVYGAWSQVLYVAALDNEVELRAICVWLRRSNLATQVDLAAAFGHTTRTQRRWEQAYERDGLDGLRRQKAPGPEYVIQGSPEISVRRWHSEVNEVSRIIQ